MKKLLVLMLVLGMASLANATMVIVDNADGTFDIKTDVELLTTDYYYLELVGDTTKVTISGGDIASGLTGTPDTDWALNIGDDAAGNYFPVPTGENGVWMTELLYTAGLFPAETVLFEGIGWEFVGGTSEATITLNRVAEDFGSYSYEDSVVVPEPMTIALLGLGGLFLRRRK